MAYTVLARKYRPQTFADLVGQEHVTRTLGNAIRSERVAHAFLFTGVRGVGKTTTARILAKALNCEKGPTPEPCGVCDACVDIAAGRDTDVHEMDGASNNSVEDVRRLQESLPYRPARDRFKVVIVDEVHMLSTGAFNAFLKTLEEPPDHVKFIFATTEIHKVPVTIRSRCQRYDFRLIPQSVVADAVRQILEAEGAKADDAAVAIVAREAAGSMRDALTLLDQIVAFGGTDLKGEEVARVLGIADREAVHLVAAAVLGGDGGAVLGQVDAIASHGLDMLHFARQLLELFRDMVVLQVAGVDSDLVAMVDEERRRAAESGASVDLQELQRAFSALSKVVDDVAQSGTPRTTLEMGLVRLATRPPLLPLAELVARLDAIERRGGGGGGGGARPKGGGGRAAASGAAPARAGGPSGPAAAPTAAAEAVVAGTAPDQNALPRRGSTSTETANALPDRGSTSKETENALSDRGSTTKETANALSDRGSTSKETENALSDRGSTSKETENALSDRGSTTKETANALSDRGSTTKETENARSAHGGSAPGRPAPSNGASSRPSPARPRTPSERAGGGPTASSKAGDATAAMEVDSAAWERIVSAVMDAKPALGAVLQHGAPLAVSAERVVLSFPRGSFFGRQVEALDGRDAIEATAARVLGARPKVEVTYVDGDPGGHAKTLVQAQREKRDARLEETRQKALNHPLVVEAAQLFRVAPERMKVRVELE